MAQDYVPGTSLGGKNTYAHNSGPLLLLSEKEHPQDIHAPGMFSLFFDVFSSSFIAPFTLPVPPKDSSMIAKNIFDLVCFSECLCRNESVIVLSEFLDVAIQKNTEGGGKGN